MQGKFADADLLFYTPLCAFCGTNITRSCIPNPSASLFIVYIEGLASPVSMRLISACEMPVLADNSFCVSFVTFLASNSERIS